MEIAYQSKAEVEHFYKDIFEKEIYLKNGISINPGDCIFDVGANIGLFALFAHQKQPDLDIYVFEPAPPLVDIIRTNARIHGVNARIFACGLSDQSKSAVFTFYPKSSGMSSFYADEHDEKEVLRAIMRNQLQHGVDGMREVIAFTEDILTERFKHETYECQLRSLSEIIAENRVRCIHLLKIDAQKSELDILKGIRAQDWHKINQLVIEIHDIGNRVNTIVGLLASHGYKTVIEQDDLYGGSTLYNLYAVRT